MRGVDSLDHHKTSTNDVNKETLYEEPECYRDLISKQEDMCRQNWFLENDPPAAIFEPDMLDTHNDKSQTPIHVTLRWGSHVTCESIDEIYGELLDLD